MEKALSPTELLGWDLVALAVWDERWPAPGECCDQTQEPNRFPWPVLLNSGLQHILRFLAILFQSLDCFMVSEQCDWCGKCYCLFVLAVGSFILHFPYSLCVPLKICKSPDVVGGCVCMCVCVCVSTGPFIAAGAESLFSGYFFRLTVYNTGRLD